MSSSFVKDCSDVSTPGNSSSGKTVIIIVNNETGNVSLDQDELQNLLASHGADGSQVSVVRMGSGGVMGNFSETFTSPSIIAAADGTAHVNLTVEGYPAIPLEGNIGGGINYAELPLDQDAFQRLESVLDSEEAREILGEPLLNMVTNPDQLGPLDQLMDSSLFEGADEDDDEDDNEDNDDDVTENVSTEGSTTSKKSRSPPKRRSQRQMDKAVRDEVEKILAENQKLMQEEKQQLNEQQVLEKMQQMSTDEGKEGEGEDQEDSQEEEEEEEQEEEEEEMEHDKSDDEEAEKAISKDNKKGVGTKNKGKGCKSEAVDNKLKGKGRGRIRGKGKVETEKEKPQEMKGKGKGKKKVEEEESEVVGVGRGSGRGKGRGSVKEDNVGMAKGRGRGVSRKEVRETGGVGKKRLETVIEEKNVSSVNRRKKTDEKENNEDKNKSKSQKANKKGNVEEKVNKKGDKEEKGNKKSDKGKGDEAIHKDNAKNDSNAKKSGNQKEDKDKAVESDKRPKLRKGIRGRDENTEEVTSSETHNNNQEKNDDKISTGGRRKVHIRTSKKETDDVAKTRTEIEKANKETKIKGEDELKEQKKSDTQSNSDKSSTGGRRKIQIRSNKKDSDEDKKTVKETTIKDDEDKKTVKETTIKDEGVGNNVDVKEQEKMETEISDTQGNSNKINSGGRRKIQIRSSKKEVEDITKMRTDVEKTIKETAIKDEEEIKSEELKESGKMETESSDTQSNNNIINKRKLQIRCRKKDTAEKPKQECEIKNEEGNNVEFKEEEMETESSDTQNQDKEIVAGFNSGSKVTHKPREREVLHRHLVSHPLCLVPPLPPPPLRHPTRWKRLQIKQLKIAVDKMNIQEALEKEIRAGIDMDSSSEIPGNLELERDTDSKVIATTPKLVEGTDKDTDSKDSKIIAAASKLIEGTDKDTDDKDSQIFAAVKKLMEGTENDDSKIIAAASKFLIEGTEKDKGSKSIPTTPNLISDFLPSICSTPLSTVKGEETNLQRTPIIKGGKNIKGQKILPAKKNNPMKNETIINVKVDKKNEADDKNNSEASKIDAVEMKPLEKTELLVVNKTKLQENGNPLATNKVIEKEESESNVKKISDKMSIGEGKSRLIQVKSPISVRQVVVLSSAKAAMNKETLVKVIDPIDPPREEDRLSVAKICANAKKEAAQKKKLDLHKKKNGDTENQNDVELLESKEKQEGDMPNKVIAQKTKGKTEVKTSKLESQKREAPPPKIVDLEMKLEDSVQAKKREAQRKREEIQRKREEILRKREAIKLRKEQQRQESLQMKKEESLQMKKEENNEQVEQENRVEKPIPKNKGSSVVLKNQTTEVLKRNNSQEPQAKREVKVILPSNKGQGAQKTESAEVLPKNKGQTPALKNQGQTPALKNQGQTPAPKNQGQTTAPKNQGQTPAPKNQGQTPTPKNLMSPAPKNLLSPAPKNLLSEVPQKGKVQVTVTKNQVTSKGNAKKEAGVIATRRGSNNRKAVEVKPVTVPEESPVRRSGRAIKKKTFGDEMVTFDLKSEIAPDIEDDAVTEDDFASEMDEDEESLEDYDDPERLWCVCQKPHNNRFMICCDRCEDWFHGTCVGITKAIGQQMEDEGQEWVCPKCKKLEKAMKGITPSSKKVELVSVTSSQALPVSQRTKGETKSNASVDTKAEPKKNVIVIDSKKEVQLSQPVSKKISVTGKKLEVPSASPKSLGKTVNDEKKSEILDELPSSSAAAASSSSSSASSSASTSKEAVNENKCVLESCNRPPKADSVYCSNECVLKHAQLSLKILGKTDKDLEEHQIAGVSTAAFKSEPRVLVYEKNTGKILSGSEAPSLREVKGWLKDHPDYAVLQPGMMRASGAVVKTVKTDISVPGSDALGQKKVIHLSTQPAVSASAIQGTPPKLTVVKAADGRIIVKSTEALSKGIVNKIVSTTTMPAVTKSVVVNSIKPSVASAKAIVKDIENKVSESDTGTKNLEPASVKNNESVPVRKNMESSPVKKNVNTITVKKIIESSPVKKNIESIPLRKTIESSPVKKNIDFELPDLTESPTKNTEAPSFKNIDSVNLKNLESPTKLPDTTTAKVTSPVKDNKKIVVKPVVEKKTADPNIVRGNVRKTLAECLLKRSKESTKEFEDLTEEDISELAEEIERELYLFFGKDVGFKYKSRYRSLLFNIRDTKNSGLFRKILNGAISPSNLAKMTSEELASKELAEWREREEKKELQAIEKYELDMISLGNQYIMKSHKGEIEIDKDEFIKDKEKAPETINSLPADSVMDLLEDTTSNHKTHMYDLNCKICTKQQDLSTVPQDTKNKGKYPEKKDLKEEKRSDPLKVKDRKERKSSSDRDRKDKERHRHKSKDHDKDRDKKHKRERSKEKDKERDDAKSRNKETDKEKKTSDKEKEKYKDKYRSRKDSERERHKSADKKERRDSKDKEERERKHKHKKDRRDSKDERDRKRKDSDREERKRKHSESRSEDRKRRDSEKSRQKESDIISERELEADKMENEKAVVSTSEDVVIDLHRSRRESFSHLDAEAKDAVPTSTVMGSPDIIEIKDDDFTTSYEIRALGYSPVFNIGLSRPPLPMNYPHYIPPLPGDEAPLPPPLPDSPATPPYIDIPVTPPLPDSPVTPPLPDSLLESPKTPSLPEEICLSPSIADDDDDFPATPPLPDDDDDNDDDDDIPATPPLPSEMDSTLLYKPKSTTPPLPNSKSGLLSSQPSSSVVDIDLVDIDRLTPPLESVHSNALATSPVPAKSAEPVIVWKGAIHMADVSKFNASAFEVSGKARFLPEDVPKVVEVVGRISPDIVWSYIAQTKKTGSKEILVVRFQPSNEEEKVSYIALYSYLSSKKRYGVIGNCEKAVKDFYIVPLASHQPIPQVLLPLDGPGFEEHRAHMLIGVIIRAKHRRIYDHITGTWQIVGSTNNTQSNPLHKSSDVPERSYTPPLPTDQDIDEILLVTTDSSEDDSKFPERSTTPPLKTRDRDEDSSEFLHPSSLKRQARSQSDSDQPKKRVSLDQRVQDVTEALLRKEPKSPKESSFAEGSLDQESMLAELNRQIEVHKKELSEMQKTVLNEEEEPYSPSRSNTASPGDEPLKLDTSKINIPSNLQEILNNIKEKEVEIKNKEQEIKRRLNLATDPIVMNYGKFHDTQTKMISDDKSLSSCDVDLRPVLHSKPKEVEHKEDVDLRLLQGRDAKEQPINSEVFGKSDDTDLRVRDPRLARAHAAAVMEAIEKGKTLRKLTDEELLAKALEMEGRENSSKQSQLNLDVDPVFQPVPPPPFMSAGPSGFIPQPGGPMVPTNTMACPQSPGIVGSPFMSQMGAPAQPVGMYGGRNQGAQGLSIAPSSVHEPPGPLGPHSIQDHNPMGPCGPPIHDAAGLQGCGPGSLEPPQRYGQSSRYHDDGHWERNYNDTGRDWEYNYDRFREGDHGRESDRYRENDRCRGNDRHRGGDHYRERDKDSRDRDWRRRQDRDGGYQRYPYRRNKQFDNRSGGGGGSSSGGGDHERKRDRSFYEKSKKKKNYRGDKSKNKKWGSTYGNMSRKNKDFKDNRESNRGPQDDEDDDNCPYEIDY